MERNKQLELLNHGISHIEVDGAGKNFMMAVATDENSLKLQRDIIQRLNGKFPIKEVEIEGRIVLVEENELYIPGHVWPSRSPDSKGIYFMQSLYKSPGVLGYFIEEGETVSYHHHSLHREVLKRIHGEAEVTLNEEAQPFLRDLIVQPGIRHMVEGKRGGAIIVVVTSGSEDCFNMSDHHYYPKLQLHPLT